MCKIEGCGNRLNKNYGGYCTSHRRKYLIYDDLIVYERFTGKISDYLKSDIIKTLMYFHPKIISWKKIKKNDLYNTLKALFEEDQTYNYFLNEDNIKSVRKVQDYFKNKLNINLRGEGFNNKGKCHNTTDFFTYDTIDEIDDKYFFSYKDSKSFIWFFDIRSFNKLIEMRQNNPYTREEIPEYIIKKAKALNKKVILDKTDEYIDPYQLGLTRKQIIKQKTIDIFSQLEQYGYECDILWFLNMNIHILKKLYRSLEDIWNYRLDLTTEVKSRISPPNGLVFNIPISQVDSINNNEDIQEIILNEVSKFNNAILEDDKILGYMYFLLGLGTVSRKCFESHQWMMNIIH